MIWLVGGTSESRVVARALSAAGIGWVATVSEPRATRLYSGGQVVPGRLTAQTLPAFLSEYGIRAIVDASHPFAVTISRLAIASGLPYLRYERPALPTQGLRVANFAELNSHPLLHRKRVLLTVGVNPLPELAPLRDQATLWARVLPESIPRALAAGFLPEQVIPMQPPVSEADEATLWQSLGIEVVVSKAGGEAGGEATKRRVAEALGVSLLVVERPQIGYPQQTSDLEHIVAFARDHGGP